MPRKTARQVSSAESQEGVYTESRGALYGDSVLVDGVDAQALRRAHMRAQTTARQAAERRHDQPAALRHTGDQGLRDAAVQLRDEAWHGEVAAIDAAQQAWLEAQGARPRDEAAGRGSGGS